VQLQVLQTCYDAPSLTAAVVFGQGNAQLSQALFANATWPQV
jgi:hypothetical protein